MSDSAASQFTLLITEQPAKLHRFRYLKEIKNGRMGSILHSRSSAKTPVTVRVTRREADVSTECRVKLICCTVFDDLAPHPFYLFGDNCSGGVFAKEVSIPAGKAELVTSLDRIGIVCTPKKKMKFAGKTKTEAASVEETDDGGGYDRRCQFFNFFNKPFRPNPYQGKDINKLRLVFQVMLESSTNTETFVACSEPVASDPIKDAKIYSEMTVDYVVPKNVIRWDQDVWLYMKDPLPAESTTRFEVSAGNPKKGIEFTRLSVDQVKRHLVVFNFKSMEGKLPKDVTLLVSVVDKETGDSSELVNLELQLLPDEAGVPATKKQRSDKTSDSVPAGDFLSYLVSSFAGSSSKVEDEQDEELSYLNDLDAVTIFV